MKTSRWKKSERDIRQRATAGDAIKKELGPSLKKTANLILHPHKGMKYFLSPKDDEDS